MPISAREDSTQVFYPEKDFVLVRYLDITKLLSILNRSALFFCRLEKMEDKFEGTVPKYTKEQELELEASVGSPEVGKKVLENLSLADKQWKEICCVNCWNIFENESAALWKIYSDYDKGIMIKTSVNRLIDSFQYSSETIFLSSIKYIDFSKEQLPVRKNLFLNVIHKQKAYLYEKEVRLIYLVGWNKDWSKEEVPGGVYINVDIDLLIEEIIVSPYAPVWFLKLLTDVLIKYGINKPIKRSELTII
jgi:hypothetical protein